MKTLFFTLVSLATAASAFAKPATFAQLEKDAHDSVLAVSAADDCRFESSVNAGVLVLSITEGRKRVAVEVKANDRISVVDKAHSSDDTDKLYSMPGGTFEMEFADDSFNHLKLTDKQGNSAKCEVDF